MTHGRAAGTRGAQINVFPQRLPVYGRSGQRTQALRALGTLRRELNHRHLDPAPMLTLAHIGLGHNEEAIALLQKAYPERASDLTPLKVDPIYDPLRGDPRFQQLLRNASLNE